MANVINIRRFVDVSTGVISSPTNVARDWGAFLFVQKGTDSQTTTLKSYADLSEVLADGSNTEAAKAATLFYGTGYNGIVPTSKFWVATIAAGSQEEFTAGFTALMADEDFYWIGIDVNFDDTMRKAAAQIVEGTQSSAAHLLVLEDFSTDSAEKTLEEDTATISAYCRNNKYMHTAVVWVDQTNETKYYGAALASYFSTRRFNSGQRRMASIAHKAAAGISPVALDGLDVTPTTAFDNLDSKNTNVYANIKIVGLPAWERGNLASGDDISDIISADYLNYVITMSVFNTLQITPRVPMNNDGAVILASAIESGFMALSAAGIISGGTSLDGEAFPSTGYKISIPIPTGVAKANGLWENIECSALLSGSAKKVVIGNTLKR